MVKKISPRAGLEVGTARSAGLMDCTLIIFIKKIIYVHAPILHQHVYASILIKLVKD